jgi:hypothetical protein
MSFSLVADDKQKSGFGLVQSPIFFYDWEIEEAPDAFFVTLVGFPL